MEAFLSILILFLFLGAGLLAAKFRLIRNSRITGKLSSIALYALLFFMGFRIASSTGMDSLAEIGGMSVVFALSTVAGTAVVLILIYSIASVVSKVEVHAGVSGEPDSCKSADAFSHREALREPLKLLLIVVAGVFAGWLIRIPGFTGAGLSGWMLRFLLFTIGIDMASSGVNLKASLVKPETIYLPAGVVAGTLLGGLLPAAVFGLDVEKSLAVSAGLGWYSLSGVLIADMGDPILGTTAFISNILRETVALMTIPLINRSRFPHIGIGIAGATSMDVGLPLIERCCGPASVPLSITSGLVLSLLVPVLVPLLYNL